MLSKNLAICPSPAAPALNPANPEHAEILRLNRATRYIETKPENYKGLETAARSAGLL